MHLAGEHIGERRRAARYGTCCMLIPVSILNSSPDMWIVDPLPDDAMLSLPGLALA